MTTNPNTLRDTRGLILRRAVVVPLMVAALVAAAEKAGAVGDAMWQQRLLLVFGPLGGSVEFARQLDLAEAARCGARERDLLVVPLEGDLSTEVNGQRVFPASLRQSFGVEAGTFATILIGKDGTEKFRATEPVPMTRIFARIDAMPMRKNEMRRARAADTDDPCGDTSGAAPP